MIVFVHGVPETAALWDGVRSHLELESIAFQLPGFGCARPDGFAATKDAYADWLLRELIGIGGPVDLVGHDWGATLTNRIATTHGERLRSWVTDRLMHPDYEWHQFAQVWQTPGEGELFWERVLAAPMDARARAFEDNGVNHRDALALAAPCDATMAACILDLYRSAVPNPFAGWEYEFAPTSAPGMVLMASGDPFSDPRLTRLAADALGARVNPLEGLGHWWALQAPELAASVISEFVTSVE